MIAHIGQVFLNAVPDDPAKDITSRHWPDGLSCTLAALHTSVSPSTFDRMVLVPATKVRAMKGHGTGPPAIAKALNIGLGAAHPTGAQSARPRFEQPVVFQPLIVFQQEMARI